MPTVPTVPLPTSSDVARILAPGVRIAAREHLGRVRMFVIGPVLAVLLKIMVEFLLAWLTRQYSVPDPGGRPPAIVDITLLAQEWAKSRMPEVAIAMRKVERGEVD